MAAVPDQGPWYTAVAIALTIIAGHLLFSEPPVPETDPAALVWPFAESTALPGEESRHLVVWTDDPRARPSEVEGHPLEWQTSPDGQLAFVNVTTGFATEGHTVRVVTEPGPRFGVDGHNATRLTVYVFNDDDEVLAANAALSELNRFNVSDSLVALPDRPWYLGENGTTPAGTQRLPPEFRELGEQARTVLEGRPVGAVASARLAEADYRLGWLLGDLWLTVQVDELVHAP